MYYKKNTTIIGTHQNQVDYRESTRYCECCGKTSAMTLHHLIKQHVQYKGKRYTLEIPENYAILGMYCCHHLIENESQYNRAKLYYPYTKWHTLKNGLSWEYVIDKYFEGQNGV